MCVSGVGEEQSKAYKSDQEHKGSIRSDGEQHRAVHQRGPGVGWLNQERSGAIRSIKGRSESMGSNIERSIKEDLESAGSIGADQEQWDFRIISTAKFCVRSRIEIRVSDTC